MAVVAVAVAAVAIEEDPLRIFKNLALGAQMNQKNYFGTRGNHRKLPEITGVQQRSVLPAVSREGGSIEDCPPFHKKRARDSISSAVLSEPKA